MIRHAPLHMIPTLLTSLLIVLSACAVAQVRPATQPNAAPIAIAIVVGYDFGRLHLIDNTNVLTLGYSENDPGYQAGLAAEIFVPYTESKGSLMAQPSYQVSMGSNPNRFHNSVEIPAGVRRYFYLKNNTALFLGAFAVVDFATKYHAKEVNGFVIIDEGTAWCAAVGGGAIFNRLSVETRFYSKRTYGSSFQLEYSKASIILAYRITNWK